MNAQQTAQAVGEAIADHRSVAAVPLPNGAWRVVTCRGDADTLRDRLARVSPSGRSPRNPQR